MCVEETHVFWVVLGLQDGGSGGEVGACIVISNMGPWLREPNAC